MGKYRSCRTSQVGWVIAWGDSDAGGLDVRPLSFLGERAIDRSVVAGYLAKFATKSTDDTGHLSKRLRSDTVEFYTTDTHPGRLVEPAGPSARRGGV